MFVWTIKVARILLEVRHKGKTGKIFDLKETLVTDDAFCLSKALCLLNFKIQIKPSEILQQPCILRLPYLVGVTSTSWGIKVRVHGQEWSGTQIDHPQAVVVAKSIQEIPNDLKRLSWTAYRHVVAGSLKGGMMENLMLPCATFSV